MSNLVQQTAAEITLVGLVKMAGFLDNVKGFFNFGDGTGTGLDSVREGVNKIQGVHIPDDGTPPLHDPGVLGDFGKVYPTGVPTDPGNQLWNFDSGSVGPLAGNSRAIPPSMVTGKADPFKAIPVGAGGALEGIATSIPLPPPVGAVPAAPAVPLSPSLNDKIVGALARLLPEEQEGKPSLRGALRAVNSLPGGATPWIAGAGALGVGGVMALTAEQRRKKEEEERRQLAGI